MERLDLNTIVFVHNGQFDWLRRRGHFQKSNLIEPIVRQFCRFPRFPDSFVEKNLGWGGWRRSRRSRSLAAWRTRTGREVVTWECRPPRPEAVCFHCCVWPYLLFSDVTSSQRKQFQQNVAQGNLCLACWWCDGGKMSDGPQGRRRGLESQRRSVLDFPLWTTACQGKVAYLHYIHLTMHATTKMVIKVDKMNSTACWN